MLDTLKKPGSFLIKTGTIIGGTYAVRGYMRERLDEVKEKMEEERRARESLRTRFAQTHEDIAYTILALLPTLSSQVLQDMDVDGLTRELQTRSRARNSRMIASRPPSSLASSIVDVAPYPPAPYPPVSAHVSEADTDSPFDVDPLTHSSDANITHAPSTYHTANSASFMSETGSVTRSWVVESGTSEVERSRSPAASAISSAGRSIRSDTSGERLSESIISTATHTTTSSEADASDTRTKAELWNEVKMLTFTRTLTTLYSSTLLCLLTTLQLTLLARGKYVTSVLQLEKQERLDERIRAKMESQLSPANLLVKGVTSWVGGMMGRGGGGSQDGIEQLLGGLGLDGSFNIDEDEDVETEDWGQLYGNKPGYPGVWMSEISEEMESKYLTMSWWLLHVGWKDVGERVRRAVEEVFNGVSLKTKLAAIDLHRLIEDVRRRVEHEITFEGNEKKTNFLSSVLPPTPETIHHVLTQGGYTSSSGSISSDYDTEVLNLHRSSHYQSQTHHHHHRNTSDSSTSMESSQLSYNFVNSPALAISTHPGQAAAIVGEDHLRLSHHPHARYPHHSQHAHFPNPNTYLPEPSTGITYLPPPPPTQYSLLDAPFVALIEETRAILASPDFGRVLEVCLDRATEILFEGLENNVFGRDGSGLQDEEQQRIRLAGLLPGLARWSQLALDGLPNELIDSILNLREVSCLSAIAFSRFEERFQ